MSNKKEDIDIAISMAQNQIIQIEGEKASQMLQAYKGVRYDALGNDLNHQGRSLKQIHKYSINRKYVKQNIKQQLGFDAELIHEARINKKRIQNGSNIRIRTTDGIGRTNDTRFDHVNVNSNGSVVDNSGSQMKFYGVTEKNGKKTYKVIEKSVQDVNWDRYDRIDIPKEQLKGAKNYANSRADEFLKQAELEKQKGNIELYEKLFEKSQRYKKAAQKIRAAELSTNDAFLSRISPKLFTANEMIKDISHAGIEAMKGAALAEISVSIAQNLYESVSGNKSPDEAIKDITVYTVKSASVGFGTGALGSAIKALMHTSGNEVIRRCGTSSMPVTMATSIVEVSKSIHKYASGIIGEEDLLLELGNKGTGILASGYGAAIGATLLGGIGSIALPIFGTMTGTAIGGFIGSIVGYSISNILYGCSLDALTRARISDERKSIIEGITRKSIDINNQYIDKINKYLSYSDAFYKAKICEMLNTMRTCIFKNNFNEYIKSIDLFAGYLGINLEIKTYEEFDDIMLNESATLIL